MTQRIDPDSTVVEYFLLDPSEPETLIALRAPESESTKPSEEQQDDRAQTSIGGARVAKRVREARLWWRDYETSTVHARCCNVKARGIVGNGFTIVGPDGKPAKAAPALLQDITDVLQRSRFEMFKAARDWEVTGWCNFELQEYLVGQRLYKLNHLDSWTMYPTLDGEQFVHSRNSSRRGVRYARFGTDSPLLKATQLNNMHWPFNTWYGVPDAASVLTEIETIWCAIKLNREFFARRGSYRWLLVLRSPQGQGLGGGDATYDKSLIKEIHTHIEKVGKEGSRTDILQVPIGNREVQMFKLDADVKDMDYGQLMERYDDRIMATHGVPPSVAGFERSGALSGDQAAEQRINFRDETLSPKQDQWDEMLTAIVQWYWQTDLQIKLNPITVNEMLRLAQPVATLFNANIIPRSRALQLLGEQDYDEGEIVWAYQLPSFADFGPPEMAQPTAKRKK